MEEDSLKKKRLVSPLGQGCIAEGRAKSAHILWTSRNTCIKSLKNMQFHLNLYPKQLEMENILFT